MYNFTVLHMGHLARELSTVVKYQKRKMFKFKKLSNKYIDQVHFENT